MTKIVRDARPPLALVRILNPIMRIVLRLPLGRFLDLFALLEFQGIGSGRRYLVPTGFYRVKGMSVVFTPADWRANFSGGAPVIVHHRGRASRMIGTLIADPSEVALYLRAVLANGSSARLLGIDSPPEHELNAADVVSLDRGMIQFRPID